MERHNYEYFAFLCIYLDEYDLILSNFGYHIHNELNLSNFVLFVAIKLRMMIFFLRLVLVEPLEKRFFVDFFEQKKKLLTLTTKSHVH